MAVSGHKCSLVKDVNCPKTEMIGKVWKHFRNLIRRGNIAEWIIKDINDVVISCSFFKIMASVPKQTTARMSGLSELSSFVKPLHYAHSPICITLGFKIHWGTADINIFDMAWSYSPFCKAPSSKGQTSKLKQWKQSWQLSSCFDRNRLLCLCRKAFS